MSTRPLHARGASGPAVVPTWAALCFVASGAAGLLYELVWSKQISYLLGSSLHSVAVVVAAFLGGLALGARLLGGPLARTGDPARRYAVLEFAVAGVGLAILPALRLLDGPVGHLYRASGGEGAAFSVTRVVLLFVLLVPPAMLMGATLPLLVARCERGVLGAGLAWLYALNTLGAVVGSLLGGFLLMPRWGLTATTLAAAALNLMAGGVAWLAAARASPAAAPAAAVASLAAPIEPLLPLSARRVLGVAFAVSGFAALALQLSWVRLYSLVLGSSVYSFSAVLGVYLCGIALGSALAAPLLRRARTAGGLALAQLAIAASAVAGIHAWSGLPRAMLELGERMGDSWSGLLAAQLGLVVPVLLVPCMILGAVFPLATRLLQHEAGGPATGHAYALNTVGTIVGSLLTGFYLLPRLGVQGGVLLAAGLSASVGLVCLVLPGAPRARARVLAGAGALVLLGVAAAVTAPRWDPVLMSLGTYRPFHAQNLLQSFRDAGGLGDATRQVAAAQRVLFYEEGINASVLVATDLEGRRRWMRVGGKIDAGTGDMLTQVLLGLVPAVMADTGARTLIVGHGSGFTAAAALAAGVGPTDVVELEQAVVRGSRLFHDGSNDPLRDPRVTLYLEDARTRLMHGQGRYDLIISEPTNPWIAGVNNLFTVDFYRRVRARLAPDGVFGQWIQVYELSPGTFHSLLGAFLSVFPEAHLFCLWRSSDVLLVAAPPGRELPLARLQSAAVAEQLRRARLDSAEEIAAFYVNSGAALRRLVKPAPLNTDDRPFVEYRAPRDLIEVGRGRTGTQVAVASDFPRAVLPPAGGPLAAWPRESVWRWRAKSRLENADDAQAKRVFAELRDGGDLPLATSLAQEWSARVRAARRDALLERAHAQERAGDAAGARAALEEVARDPEAPMDVWVRLALLRRQLGDVAGSGEAARVALRSGVAGAQRVEALLHAGMAAQAVNQSAEAFAHFREAQAVAPSDPRGYDYEARMLVRARDLTGARAVVERGLRHAPGDASLLEASRALARAR